jgi:hypothetical protein
MLKEKLKKKKMYNLEFTVDEVLSKNFRIESGIL